ncbi:MAG: hypothetical protein KAS75_02845 [Planctomycetes bacterium]|nr:hypothetical protein [Planctomycetota bacterium]
MQVKKSVIGILYILILVGIIDDAWAGKSVYTIVDTEPSKVRTYKINGNSLTYLTEYDSPYAIRTIRARGKLN